MLFECEYVKIFFYRMDESAKDSVDIIYFIKDIKCNDIKLVYYRVNIFSFWVYFLPRNYLQVRPEIFCVIDLKY